MRRSYDALRIIRMKELPPCKINVFITLKRSGDFISS